MIIGESLHVFIQIYPFLYIYGHCGYVNVFVGNLPAMGDVYGCSLCRLMMKKETRLQHIISFTCNSFTSHSNKVTGTCLCSVQVYFLAVL